MQKVLKKLEEENSKKGYYDFDIECVIREVDYCYTYSKSNIIGTGLSEDDAYNDWLYRIK